MYLKLKLILVLGIIHQHVCIEGETEIDKVFQRLDVIDTKLAKVDALIAGFEQLCETFRQTKAPDIDHNRKHTILCDEKDKRTGDCMIQGRVITNANENIKDVDNDKERSVALELVSVQSEGIIEGVANVSVVYLADKTYVSEWFIRMKNFSGMTTNGVTEKKVKHHGRVEFTSRIILRNFESLEFLVLSINSQTYNAYLDINTPMLTVKGKELFKPEKNRILDYKPQVSVPDNTLRLEGFKTALTVTEDTIDEINSQSLEIEASMDVFNWTSRPPIHLNKWYQPITKQDSISLSIKNDSGNELEIKVENDLAVFGGIIKIYFCHDSNRNEYLRGYSYGVQIKFVNEEMGDILPYGSIELGRIGVNRYIPGSSFSLVCKAFGIPIPKLKIFMKTNDGKKKELPADYKIELEPFVYKVINYFQNSNSVINKTIVCEASDGKTTVLEETKYLPLIKAEIDNKKTRVVKNMTEKVIVVCKASGSPLPKLELRSGDENGQDLLEDKRFSHKLTKKKQANKVTLTMSPRDQNIRSIICVAIQHNDLKEFYIRKMKEIRILPARIDIGPVLNNTLPVGPYELN